jgi:hypothetical protein
MLWASQAYIRGDGPVRPGGFGKEGSVSAYETASRKGLESSAAGVDSCTPPDNWSDTVTLYPQLTTDWCWAASGQMILDFFKKHVSQCRQANEQFGLNNCCSNNTPGDCIKGGWPHFETYGLKPTLTCNQALSWDEVKTQIYCKQQPFAFSWRWPTGGGHMMVAIGYKTDGANRLVCVNNPLPEGTGDYYCHSYEEYVSTTNHHTHWNDYYAFTQQQRPAATNYEVPCAPPP